MTELEKMFNRATDALFLSTSAPDVVITPEFIAPMEEKLRLAVIRAGWPKDFTVKVALSDEDEFVDCTILSAGEEVTVGLHFGGVGANVDADGDGK